MTATLNPGQQKVGDYLYALARTKGGLDDARAREFVDASIAEAGLSPTATNPSSRAAGAYQLLSPGYVHAAEQIAGSPTDYQTHTGGAYDLRANALAILPAYKSYWQKNPGAPYGAGARDVELSGEGTGFYTRGFAPSGPTATIPAVAPPAAGGDAIQTSPAALARGPGAAGNTVPRVAAPPANSEDARRAFTLALLGAGGPNGLSTGGLLHAIQVRRQILDSAPRVSSATPVAPAVPEPSAETGQSFGHGGQAEDHSGHGATLKWLSTFAKPYGLTVTATTNGHHVEHSYHYLSRATDFSGPQDKMMELAKAALGHPHDFVEMFYTPAGAFIKNGQVYPISQLDARDKANHYDHVHLAR